MEPIAVLAITAIAAAASGAVASTLRALRSWGQVERAAKVVLESEGERLELSDLTPAEQHRVIEAFLERHQKSTTTEEPPASTTQP